jgi:hypothetical protein
MKTIGTGILVNACICGQSLPASESISKIHIKVTNEEAILRDKTLSIMVGSLFRCRRCSMDMTAIQCTDGILKKQPELQILTDFLGN